jgi:putative Holliday junction resolvase
MIKHSHIPPAPPPPPPGEREIRILGLDVGEKRIGLAVSDALGITAQGLGVLARQGGEADLQLLEAVARDYRVQEIVVGVPRHLDGGLGQLAPMILKLAQALGEALGVPVIPWDERLTTMEAERVLLQADLSRRRRRRVVDQLAAVLILQAYLDYRSLS